MTGKFNIEENEQLKKNPFSVPENYFIQLPSEISLKKLKGEDLSVPEGYFDSLSSRILGKIRMEKSGKENSYSTPENYFEELPGKIKASIVLEEMKAMKENPYGVPDGYFEELNEKIKTRIEEGKGGEVISFTSYFRKTQTWAVAAAISALLALGILLNTNNNNGEVLLSENTKQQIIENPDQFNIDEASLLDAMGVSSDAIEEGADDAAQYLLESDADLGSEINEN